MKTESIPYAQFRYNGEVVCLNRDQYKQALSDAKICRCHKCLACRAAEYDREAQRSNSRY